MRKPSLPLRIALAGLFSVAVVVAVVIWAADIDLRSGLRTKPLSAEPETVTGERTADSGARRKSGAAFTDRSPLSDAGLAVASQFIGPIRDPKSLLELRESLQGQGRRGLAALQPELDRLQRSLGEQFAGAAQLHYNIGLLLIYEGRFDEAAARIKKIMTLEPTSAVPPRRILTALLGIIALRRGEVDNCIACIGPSSCIFPIAPEATHQYQAGSREAIQHFTAYLAEAPGDLRIRWLLNLAYMTLGEYPDKVPAEYLIPLDSFESKIEVGRFENVAPLIGLTSRGVNCAGGSVFDDFTGDGLPDLFTTSLDVDRGATLYVNRGDGRFEDHSDSAGLGDQIYALNVTRADFDNDGNLDVLLLRGGWELPMRLSLLRNKGDGIFEDVTIASGLGEPIATESAAWGDYDNDGLVDLFVCGEYRAPFAEQATGSPDPRNRCRLYHNLGNGKFVDVAAAAGVASEMCAKGCAWGDYDGDGRPDLYVSNMNGAGRLYHNQGDGTFRDVAPELGVTGPSRGFACWFWDYDNDGRLDLYVNDYSSSLAEGVASALGMPINRTIGPRLYRNLGDAGFEDVTHEVGLDRAMMPMGCNFGDIDNDGYLDVYFGTGQMFLENLVPNLMFKNVAGQRFEDITMSSGTGHLQKGHGVSFADWDGDGNLDFFVEVGGAVPGDRSYNLLFRNPGQGHHWLKVKLVGTTTNRAALGAKIRAVVKGADGTMRSIYRTVGNNSSFGGNSLVESIGLLDATNVTELEVTWPTSRTTQTFRDLAADQLIEIIEGVDSFEVIHQPRLPLPQK